MITVQLGTPPPPMQMEQEMEQIREANQLLEASTQRREALEKAMRRKLEEELRQQKETNLQLQGGNEEGGGRERGGM